MAISGRIGQTDPHPKAKTALVTSVVASEMSPVAER